MPDTDQVKVTLTKAQTYIHQPSGLRFEFDTPRIVGKELAEYLFDNATKSAKITSGGRVSREDIRLFDFSPVDEDELTDEEVADVAKPQTLDTILKGGAVPSAAKAPAAGGDGQARSRARGAGKVAGQAQA